MLKFLFWTLLLANAGLAAYQFGYLDTLLPNGHEPGRLGQQIQPDRLRLVPAPPPEPPPPAIQPAPESTPDSASRADPQAAAGGAAATGLVAATGAAPVPACLEVGNFNQEEAQRFIAGLGNLGARTQQRTVQEAASHMVYMPPQGDREGAERKAGELHRLGVADFFIIQDNSSLRWGISLGVFKTEEAARTHLARLNQKGVRTARIGQRSAMATQVAFQFRGLDHAGKGALEQAKAGFGRQELKECAAA
jgi:hypothetical protein